MLRMHGLRVMGEKQGERIPFVHPYLVPGRDKRFAMHGVLQEV